MKLHTKFGQPSLRGLRVTVIDITLVVEGKSVGLRFLTKVQVLGLQPRSGHILGGGHES
jgi:hypothetical protein